MWFELNSSSHAEFLLKLSFYCKLVLELTPHKAQLKSSVSRIPLRRKLKLSPALLLLLAAPAALLLSHLGASRDFVRAESYFALGARLMMDEGNWLSPHAPDEPVLNKPPLQYWLTGLTYKLFGPGFATARLPSAIASLLVLVVVYLLGTRLFERTAGWFAVGSLMTSYLFWAFSRTAMSDMLLALCVSSALACFIAVVTGKAARNEMLVALCGHLFVALGVLAKGPVAVVLVAGPLLFELLLSRQWSMLKSLRILRGALIILAVAGPYFLLLYLRLGIEPLQSFFIGENLQRFTGEIYSYATRPVWHLPLAFMSDFAPWSLLLFPAIYFDWRNASLSPQERRARRLIYLWLFFPLVFFSFSHFKLDYYLLPAMPAAALAVGGFLARAPGLSPWAHRFIYAFTILFSLVVILASVIAMRIAAGLLLDTSFGWLMLASSTGAFLFVLHSVYKGWPRRAAWSLIFSIWFVLLVFEWTLAPALSQFQPVGQLAAHVPQSAAHIYTSRGASDWANTLAFHLPSDKRVIRLATDSGDARLKEVLKREAGVVVLIREEEYERLLAEGIALRPLAEGETLGHGGLTLRMFSKPERTRLRIVQGAGGGG